MKENENEYEYVLQVFCVPSTLEKMAGVYPIRIGRNESKPNYQSGPRFIAYYSLHFVLEGEGVFVSGEQSMPLVKGDLFCLFPDRTFQIHTNPKKRLRMFWLGFNGQMAASIIANMGLVQELPHLQGVVDSKVREILEELWKVSHNEGHRPLSRISVMYRLFDELIAVSEQFNPTAKDARLHKLVKSLEYMDMHYAEGIAVGDVAAYIGVHRSYFSTWFTSEQGCTPLQYLLSLKMEKAMQMLREPVYKITDIAMSLGYIKASSFSKAFKHYYGLSPAEYRQRAQDGGAEILS